MSDEREPAEPTAAEATDVAARAPGAPVEEDSASATEVMRAVERSRDAGDTAIVLPTATEEHADGSAAEAAGADGSGSFDGSESAAAGAAGAADEAEVAASAAAETERRRAVSELDTQLDLQPAVAPKTTGRTVPPTTLDDLPSAAAESDAADELLGRDGEIRISADHPMAALYMQSPMPPEIRGNRAAGALISLLAAVAFAAVLAGAIALWLAPQFPPSTFMTKGLLPILTSVGYFAAIAAFFLAMVVLVLVVGRAGWWAYVLGGFLVAVAVWAATVVGLAMHDRFILGATTSLQPLDMIAKYGLSLPAIAAAIVAREASVWFGAWIGARGRRMKLRNAESLAEYDEALAEAQAKQS